MSWQSKPHADPKCPCVECADFKVFIDIGLPAPSIFRTQDAKAGNNSGNNSENDTGPNAGTSDPASETISDTD